MNQIEKRFFGGNDQMRFWQMWFWTFLQWGVLLSFFVFFFGWVLWIQCVVLSFLILLTFVVLFVCQVNRSFKGTPLTGYDPWHLKILRQKYLPQVEVIIHSHSTPFVSGYDFYKNKKLILSSSFIKRLNKEEIKMQMKALSVLFNHGFFQNSTWMSYLFFLIFLPFQPVLFLLKRYAFLRHFVGMVPSFLCFFVSLPFRYWIYQRYYRVDEKLSALFKTKKKYSEWIWQMHAFWTISDQRPPVFLTPLFLTNPLTQSAFCFNIHPGIERRIEKLTGAFPI